MAVVTGELIDLPKTAGERDKPPLLTLVGGDPVAVDFVGGAAIYRRSVLDRVGTFNPYLCSEEEPELALRIRHAGYRAVRLPFPIAYHYSSPSGAYTTMLGRWQRRLYLGPGQCIRYLLGTERFWPYLRARGWGLAPAVGAATGVASLAVSARTRRPTWIATWTALLALLVLGDAYRKRSLYRATASLLERTLILDGTVRGFLMTPHDPDRYPAAFDVIAEGPAEVEPPSLRRVTG